LGAERQPRGEEAGGETRPVLVLGAAGQLGTTITGRFAGAWPIVALTRADLDLKDPNAVLRRVLDLQPWAIVNCVAYNMVDDAEDQAVEALETNAFVVRSLARAAERVGAVFVHYSTDFVFDGESERPYREEDSPNPRSVYAASKLLGEWFAADAASHYVLRVESLFGGATGRKGSLDKIIDSIEAGEPVRVFIDRVVSPSYVVDVSDATASLLRSRPAPGLYHCVNGGAATWFDVACEVRRRLESAAAIEPITTKDARLRAPRPRFCALSNEKLRAAGVAMPTWQDALGRALETRRTRRSTHAPEITEKTKLLNG
jgi:dTDP-4-dehydrorhamnose reductase